VSRFSASWHLQVQEADVTQSFPRIALLAAALTAVVAAEAGAQDLQRRSRSLVPATFPRWDASGSIGFLTARTSDTRTSWGEWDQKADYRFDLGRYWSTHLKTDVAVATSNPWDDYESEVVSIPGVPRAYAYNTIDRQLHSVAPAVTWQFRENTFMHPYVSGGVKVNVLSEHRYRNADSYRFNGINDPVPDLDERRTVVMARPFVAGGFKSYISRSVFTRTEGRVAFAEDGVRQVSLVIGVGIDF
jgi:hypothetical protein